MSQTGAGTTRARRDPRFVRHAFERFLDGGDLPLDLDPTVTVSWRRCRETGINPDRVEAQVDVSDTDFHTHRDQHELAQVMPLIRNLLVDGASDDDLLVAVSDDAGRLLWIEGSRRTRSVVEPIGFVEGAVWAESQMGTNAPGTALATGSAVRVLGAEHFARPIQGFNCVAAPIRDLRTGRTVGVLDLTGGDPAGSTVALSLVRTTALMVERELAALDPPRIGRSVELVLGPDPQLHGPDGPVRLSLRHAEILTLLAAHPDGLTAAELAVLLHPGDLSEVTVRAEVSRLRRAAGHLLADSRPYRLVRPPVTAAAVVRDHLARGDVAAAVAADHGPLLPRSTAPGVEDLREELRAELRTAVAMSRDPAVVEAWTRTDDGASDYRAWQLLLELAPPGSPAGVRARARLEHLDLTLR